LRQVVLLIFVTNASLVPLRTPWRAAGVVGKLLDSETPVR
jgi:hypothetical protein